MDGKLIFGFSPHPPSPNAHERKVNVDASIGEKSPIGKAEIGLDGYAQESGWVRPNARFPGEKHGSDVEDDRNDLEE